MSAATAAQAAAATERASVLEIYRDDGPLAAAIGAALGGRSPLPAIALLFVAALPGLVAIVVEGDGASQRRGRRRDRVGRAGRRALERPPAHRPPALGASRPRCA